MAPGRRLRAPLIDSVVDPPLVPATNHTSGSSDSTPFDGAQRKQGRGPTRGFELEKKIQANGGRPLPITVPVGKRKAIGPNTKDFSSLLGYIIRHYGPVRVKGFSDIKIEDLEHLYPYVEDKFDVNIMENETIKNCVHSIWGAQFRSHRNAMHKYFKSYVTFVAARAHPYRQISQDDWEWLCVNIFTNGKWKERSKTNAENISKLTIRHSTVQKSFLRARDEMKELDQIQFFRSTHYREGHGWTTHEAQEAYEKMVALMTEAEATGTPLDHSAIVSQVLGTRSGYIKGMGHGEPPISSSKRDRCLNCSSSQQFADVHELDDTKNELSKTKEELANTKEELANVKDQYISLSSELQQIRALLVGLGSRPSISHSPPLSST